MVKTLLNFSTFRLVKGQLCIRINLFTLLEVDGVNVEDSNKSQQENTDIFCVDLETFQQLIGFVDEGSFMSVLAILIYLNEAQFL
jgi:hypothetical protein